MNGEDFRTELALERARQRMVEEQLVARGIKDPRVLTAMRLVPRHRFVEQALWDRAYGDHALPIGERQTISQPYMVGLMTELLQLSGDERVLEIGTGSGYQAAVLARLARKVYTVERIKPLAMRARTALEALGVTNVVVKIFDGTYGWSDEAPFDAVIVTAGAPEVPQPPLDQLRDGGRMVTPVGDRGQQMLLKIVKDPKGPIVTRLLPCVFVPLIGTYGWKDDPKENGIPG